MITKLFLPLMTAGFMGCAGAKVSFAPTPNHPAHVDAPVAAFEAPRNLLSEGVQFVADPPAAQPSQPLDEPAAKALSALLVPYVAAGDKLAADKPNKLAADAKAIKTALLAAQKVGLPAVKHFWHGTGQGAQALKAADAMALAKDIKAARTEYFTVSRAMTVLLDRTGVPPAFGVPLSRMHCPMYRRKEGGATWFQRTGPVRNPFFGARMLRCANQKAVVPVAGKTLPPKKEQP